MRGPRFAAAVCAVATVVVVLVLWQNVDHKTEIYASKPSAVLHALRVWLTDDTLRGYIPITLEEAGLGLALGLAAAVVLALVLASSRVVLEVFSPYLAVANAIPKIALAPLFLVIFGIDMRSKVYFVAVCVFFIPFQGLIRALTTIDPMLKDNARMLGASRLALIRDVHLRAVISSMTASVRITAAFALLATIVAELVSSTEGVGFEISHAQQNSQPEFIIAGIILVGVIGVLADRILLLAERLLSRWQVS
jgi:NitT/TauT family transport system permease protein